MSIPNEAIDRGDDLSNSSSTSDSESESEEQHTLQIQSLEVELSNNPSNYDAHIRFIKFLRLHGHIEKLRHAREAMKELFPLPSVMWQEWAKDEISLAASRPEALNAIEKIYEQGVFDYLSVDLWCDYLNFLQEYDPQVNEHSADGILKARNLFERAITAAGLHFAEGHKIWESFKQFELAILHSIPDTDVEEKEKQTHCIRSIFHRQLSVPLSELRSTLIAYKVWEIEQGNDFDVNSDNLDGIPSHVASAYQKALEMYNDRAHFEKQIAEQDSSDVDKIQHFLTYLKFEELSGDPTRVQLLYERSIAEYPISTDIWMGYTSYLDKKLKVGNVVRAVHSRATKNCPWVGELWVRYLLSLERGNASEEEISDVFQKSMNCTFSSIDEYQNLFLTRIDGLRRRISLVDVKDDLIFSSIRDTFQYASDYMSAHLKNSVSLLNLYAYWAHLEIDLGKNIYAARKVWESYSKISGLTFEAWKGYIDMEIQSGHINEARSIYKRCYNKKLIGTGSEDICNSWLRFEREYGSLETFDHAVNKVSPRLDELRSSRLQQESKATMPPTNQKGNPLHEKPLDKRKTAPHPPIEQAIKKRKKNVHDDNTIPGNGSEADETKIRVKKADTSKGNPGEDLSPKNNRFYTDQCTVFLTNLSFQAKEKDLRDFFNDVGGVVEIRILKDKFTKKSRGIAYVEFSDEDHVAQAVAKNRQALLGKKMSIAKSDPSKRKDRQHVPFEHGKKWKQPWERARPGRSLNEGAVRTTEASSDQGNPLGNEEDKPKSNDDFRNMFLKK